MKKSLFVIIPVIAAALIIIPARQGHSFDFERYERIPPPQLCPVIINEVMFNPDGDDSSGEFIELYNTSEDEYVDISGWEISDSSGDTPDTLSTTTWLGTGGYEIPPNGFAIIVDQEGISDYSDFIQEYACPDSFIVMKVDDSSIAGGLNNGVETITIETDYWEYHISPFVACPSDDYATLELSYEHYWEGESLELDRYDDESWIQSPDPNGSTPAVVNSWE